MIDLLARQQLSHLDVGLQVHEAQIALELGNLLGQASKRVRMDCLCRKQLIQLLLLVDDECAKAHRLLVHTVIDLLRLSALLGRKLQLCGKVQHMPRAWVMVQLCRLRQAHPLTV